MQLSSEKAVAIFKKQTASAESIQNNYFDDDVFTAAKRFAQSDEWRATRRFFGNLKGRALDLGAGRGIASYALVKDGWDVDALDPDPSDVVGTGAIGKLMEKAHINIQIKQGCGEFIPYDDGVFDVVYSRQVLHHASSLMGMCSEVARVLRKGGIWVATREHVITRQEDLDGFFAQHELHSYTKAEYAYKSEEYRQAIQQAGLQVTREMGSYETVINCYPMSERTRRLACAKPLYPILGYRISNHICCMQAPGINILVKHLARSISRRDNRPGRMYSYVSRKP